MKFTAPWAFLQPPEEGGVLTPVLAVCAEENGQKDAQTIYC